jgi:hypothetical protein
MLKQLLTTTIGRDEPKPFVSLNHFTVPAAIC